MTMRYHSLNSDVEKAIKVIVDSNATDKPELMRQLAEECMELGHVALKLEGIFRGTTVHRDKLAQYLTDLNEEAGDILACLDIIEEYGELMDSGYVKKVRDDKTLRWQERLRYVNKPV